MNNEMVEFFTKEVLRMEKLGYTEKQILDALNRMERVQTLVMLATI